MLEATGGLELPLVAALAAAALPVVVVNPRQVRDATDALDAAVLAHFADAIRPEVRPLRDAESQVLNSLTARRHQVLTCWLEKNRLGTAQRRASPHRSPYRLVGTGVERLGQGVKAVSAVPRRTTLRTVPGVGEQLSSPCWPTSPSWALWTDGRSRPWWACALQPGQRTFDAPSGADAPGFGVFSTWGR